MKSALLARLSAVALSAVVCAPAAVLAQAKAPAVRPTTVPGLKAAAGNSAAKPDKVTLAQHVKDRVAATLDDAEKTNDFDVAQTALAELFDQVIAYGKDSAADEFRQADFALRLISQLKDVPAAKRADLLRYLRANDAAARELAFLVKPADQKPADVYALFDRLRAKRGEVLNKYATLAAAVCVVHAKPLARHVNENTPKAADPLAIFDYYVTNEKRMFFGVKDVPAELLVWVVDTTAGLDEMTWALNKYAGDKQVGARFFDIQYDYDHLRKGTPKRVTEQGFTLPNILRCGGVCADQAYFAMAVGKAIGVPTAYARGASAEVGHAWVGFLQADRGRGWWNFDTGRYAAYQGVRGSVTDPQTRREVPDSQVSLLAELIGTKAADRQAAAALTDAAARLAALEKDGKPLAPPPLPAGVAGGPAVRPDARKTDTAAALALVELSVKQAAGHAPAWFLVRDLAQDKKLSLKEKKRWADLLQRLGGPRYPDFTLSVLAPMIETIDDHREQNALWNAAFEMFKSRFDLAASVRMSQAKVWEAQKDTAKAGACYMDVIDRYANAGPFVIDALAKAEQLLRDAGKAERVPVLYEQAWAKIDPPPEMNELATAQSNWFRVGTIYAERLGSAGDAAKAREVEGKLRNPQAAAAAHTTGRRQTGQTRTR